MTTTTNMKLSVYIQSYILQKGNAVSSYLCNASKKAYIRLYSLNSMQLEDQRVEKETIHKNFKEQLHRTPSVMLTTQLQ